MRHTREYFASAPAGVVVARLGADKPGSVAFTSKIAVPTPTTIPPTRGRTRTPGSPA
ncbi:glycoside hydrolase N-terminal domain-containing protein [Nonomuraea sp. NPDC049152]|uniref:glycoside hydrolase N-terminal domain-containing protein n=1 Tax=Nonomuraea sp. NPDC049152 TaxID=3154350 RepID=UPI0033EA319A